MPSSSLAAADDRARRLFLHHAERASPTAAPHLSPARFLRAIPPASAVLPPAQLLLLFHSASANGSALTMDEFVELDRMLRQPDAAYRIPFLLFDTSRKNAISISDLTAGLERYLDTDARKGFDVDCNWTRLYMGTSRSLTYPEFAQLLRALPGERLRQEFHRRDPKSSGVISADAFRDIVMRTVRNTLNEHVVEHLPTMEHILPTEAGVSYAMTRAFHNVVRRLGDAEAVMRRAVVSSADGRVSKLEFARAAARWQHLNALQPDSLIASAQTEGPAFTPLEIDVLFHFASLGAEDPGRLTEADFQRVVDPSWTRPSTAVLEDDGVDAAETAAKPKKSLGAGALHGIYNFLLGSIAGAVGATVVYPIDLVKTRMQNQRSAVVGELLYKNSLDCFRKVIRNEGVIGLYRGLGPQLVGVAPEKAIKLTMNDLVRGICTDKKTGEIKFWQEVLAGCVAGGSQVIFTNPLEIVKIRLQVQGEMIKATTAPISVVTGQLSAPAAPIQRRGAMLIVRELGLLGLYKGAGACLLRDIPFSGIYFPVYAHLKKNVFHEGRNGKKLQLWELLSAGAMAGMPAAYLATPADVIKTRLQVEARAGQTTYNGIMDAARKIMHEEGLRAFFKGGVARVMRSSPQFGTTLMVYEMLQSKAGFDSVRELVRGDRSGVAKDKAAAMTEVDEEEAFRRKMAERSRNALRLLLDLDYRFGMTGDSSVQVSSVLERTRRKWW